MWQFEEWRHRNLLDISISSTYSIGISFSQNRSLALPWESTLNSYWYSWKESTSGCVYGLIAFCLSRYTGTVYGIKFSIHGWNQLCLSNESNVSFACGIQIAVRNGKWIPFNRLLLTQISIAFIKSLEC